jgi:predicted dehydrogenase
MTQRALVVGFGPAGQRHARVLEAMGLEVAVVTRGEAPLHRAWPDLATALRETAPEYIVIANRTGEHHGSVAALASSGYAGIALVEKPLFAARQDMPDHRCAAFYVGYNLRFHPALRALRERIAGEACLSAHVYVGRYLPEMRPDLAQSYRSNFRARAAEGGGVLRDFSHELDYLRWLFGDWRRVAALGGHVSALDIDADDLCAALIEFEHCPAVTLQMNYLDRSLRREIVVNCEGATWRCDLAAGRLEGGRRAERFAVALDDTYVAENRAALFGPPDGLAGAADGIAAVELVEAIERAQRERRWMERLAT